MCLDHCERILSKHPMTSNGTITSVSMTDDGYNPSTTVEDPVVLTPAAIVLPETQTHNDIVDDMMSISGTFGTMDGFPFDMTGIWDVSGLQDVQFS